MMVLRKCRSPCWRTAFAYGRDDGDRDPRFFASCDGSFNAKNTNRSGAIMALKDALFFAVSQYNGIE